MQRLPINRLGTISETEFIAEVTKRKFNVSLPIGVLPYDIIIEKNGEIKKIQIKSTHTPPKRNSCFQISLGKNSCKYKAGDFDFIAVHIEYFSLWFIIPFEEISLTSAVWFHPFKKEHRYSKFINNWDFNHK